MVIPEFVKPLLWEYDLADQAGEAAWEQLVIERVMSRGGWAAMRWLWDRFGPEQLGAFLCRRGHHALPPRELCFWSLLCGIERELRGEWVRVARERERAWRG